MSGKNVLLTGASGGIGKYISLGLAQSGFNLALQYNSNQLKLEENITEIKKNIPESSGTIIKSYKADITNESSVKELTDNVKSDFGNIDILINNAGLSVNAMSWKMDLKDWNNVLNVNLTGPFLCTKYVLPVMKKNKYGRIVYISSVVPQIGVAGTAAYSASKAGLFGLCKTVSKEIIKNFSKSGNVYYAVYSNNGDKLAVAYTREPTEKEQNKGIRLNFIVDIHETVKFEKTKTLRLSIPNDPDGELFGSNIFETYRFNSFNCAFSQDDNYLTAGSMGKNIAVYSFELKKFAPVYKGHSGRVMFVVFSDDGNYMASTSKDETVKLWDIKGGNTIITLKGHSGNVNSASFSPESKYLASASNDETVKIWDVKTSALVHTLKGFDSEVISVKFSPDGNYLAAGCEDKVLVWKTEDIFKID